MLLSTRLGISVGHTARALPHYRWCLWTKVRQFFSAQHGGDCGRQHRFSLVDISLNTGEICDQILSSCPKSRRILDGFALQNFYDDAKTSNLNKAHVTRDSSGPATLTINVQQ